VRRTVVLQRLAEAARLRILLPQPTGEPKRRAVRGAGWSLLLRRTDGPWAALGWIEYGGFVMDGQAVALTVRLQPGTWEAVVSGARHDVVGRIEPVALRAGAFVERSAHVVPSTSFSLYDVLPPDLEVRTVRVVAPGYGRLPPIGSWLSTAIRDAESLVQTLDVTDSEARRTKGGGALLGPFPGAHVVVEVDDWSGHTHRFTVGR
jgi:hypothetical protein